MASLYPKKIGGKTYWYLREMARVDGRPKMVSERYVGTAAEVEALLDAREEQLLPDRTRHLKFGDVAAVWGLLEDLQVAGIIDEVTGPAPAGLPLSPGTYLVLAALNRLVDPRSKRGFAEWWKTTAGDRFTKISTSVLDHRRFWDAMRAVPLEVLEQISRRISAAIVASCGVDCSSVALDMTNFATFIGTTNPRAPIAQRGKAKQKRADLRLVGLGLVVTRDGGIPLCWHTYPGNRPDVTQFTDMIDQLRRQYEALVTDTETADTETATANSGEPAVPSGAAQAAPAGVDMTVVFDAGQNSEDNFAHLVASRLHYIGSVPASDCADLTSLPGKVRSIVDRDRFGGLTCYETRRDCYGINHRTILTHSPELHDCQARSFTHTTLGKATKRLDDLAATLARGKTRRPRQKVEAEIEKITRERWVRRVVTWQLSGEQPKDLRLSWNIDTRAHAELEDELFGKHVLITDHDNWPTAEVIAGYRSQSEAEFSFRQLKDPHVVSFSPMHHWTDHNIRIHTFTCVLALQLAHLARYKARQAGLDISVRALLAELAGIEETVLLYQGDRGRPKAHRQLTETSPTQNKLIEIFGLGRYAPNPAKTSHRR